MIQAVYYVFFWALVGETAIFLFLNLPTPKGIKGKIVHFLSTHKFITYIMYAHLALCIMAAFFYLDLSQEEAHFGQEKDDLKKDAIKGTGWDIRTGFLSYTILRIQRNKYITVMFIYTSIALNIFVCLLRHIYRQREQLQSQGYISVPTRKQSDKLDAHHAQGTKKQKKTN